MNTKNDKQCAIISILPKKGKLTDWKNMNKTIVKILYNDKEYNIYIKEYNINNRQLKISLYKENNDYENYDWFEISTSHFLSCKFGKFLSEKFYTWIEGHCKNNFEIDYEKNLRELNLNKDEINKLTCGYDGQNIYIKCKKCNSSILRSINNITQGHGCGVCNNRIIIKGINDIATTHPNLIKYFVKIEDAYKYSYGSNQKVIMKCPDCGKEKFTQISDLYNKKFTCPKCGDGISYPEKFTMKLLDIINIDYKTQYKPHWSNNKKYDFYIKELNLILEVHGLQHYEENSRGRSLKEEQENDELKYKLAMQNGIKEENYIVIDCRKSELEFIKNSFLESKLTNILNYSNIDWNECGKFAESNIMKEVCKIYNDKFKEPIEIAHDIKVCQTTIRNWLNRGTELGICNYNGKENMTKAKVKKVINLDTNEIFNSLTEASLKYKTSKGNINKNCNGETKTAKGCKWEYYPM